MHYCFDARAHTHRLGAFVLTPAYPGLPPAPWTYQQVNGGYVVTDALGQDVLAIPFDGNQARATSIADFICDARDVA